MQQRNQVIIIDFAAKHKLVLYILGLYVYQIVGLEGIRTLDGCDGRC